MNTLTIITTSEFNPSEGTLQPVSSKYWADVNERINYRGLRSPYHIKNNNVCRLPQLTQAQRQDAYEVKCLENGLRPYGYPDNLWEEYLRDCVSEDHTAKCEAKNEWRYIN